MKFLDLLRIKVVLVLLLAGLNTAVWATADISTAKFVKASFEYKDGHYDEAIKLYEDILAGGRASGALYYNLGNAYFQKNALGKAVLSYERARRLLPRDHDLRANQQYALSLVKNPSAIEGQSVWQNRLTQFFGFLSVDEMVLIIFILGVAAGFLYLLSLYLGWRNYRRFLIPLFVLFCVFFAGLIEVSQSQENSAVMTAEAVAKFEPREGGAIHFDLPEGSEVKVLKIDGIWVKIKRADGKAGWVLRKKVEKI